METAPKRRMEMRQNAERKRAKTPKYLGLHLAKWKVVQHMVKKPFTLLIWIGIVLAIAIVGTGRYCKHGKKCNIACLVFASSYFPVETNETGLVVQPTGEEFEELTGCSRYNLLRITKDKLNEMQNVLHSNRRQKSPFDRFVAAHREFDATQVSNAFASVCYEMSRSFIPIVKVSTCSENPDVAFSVLSFWAETYSNHVREEEMTGQSKALMVVDVKIAHLRNSGMPIDKQLFEERENIKRISEAHMMKTFVLEPPHIVTKE